MYRLPYFSLFGFLSIPCFCQRNTFAVGFQSGNNINQTIVIPEFDNSPLSGDYFIGSSFGLVARSKLFKYKWQWGGFSQDIAIFAEYGVNATYSGYNYRYEQERTFQEQLTFAAPLLLVFRSIHHNYWYKNFKGKRIYPIVKTGFNFTKTAAQNSQKKYIFGEATLTENIQTSDKINITFVGALGFQKEFKNGRILYIGFSAQTPFGVRTKGTIEVNSPQINEIASITKQGNFYSIDLQYFIGKRTPKNQRKKKWGKLSKVIYNPRYL